MSDSRPGAGRAGELAYVGVGANLGDARAAMASASRALAATPGLHLEAQSSLYRSAPVDAQGPDYVNGVLRLRSERTPEDLLEILLALETAHGRERPYHHAPRTLDLDLLLQGAQSRQTPRLVLPHPRLHLRAFVLRPLLELEAGLSAPGLGRLEDFLAGVADQSIEKMAPAPW